jgi:ATP-dependent exoDNAse (exonuclease V) beta subunit
VRLKGLWENAKTAAKKLAPTLAVSDTEAMEDLQTMAPAMTALLKLTADFSDAYRTEKLRMNCADFSDQEHLALRLLVERNGAPTELGVRWRAATGRSWWTNIRIPTRCRTPFSGRCPVKAKTSLL